MVEGKALGSGDFSPIVMMLPRGEKQKLSFDASIEGLASRFEELTEAVFQKFDMREITLNDSLLDSFLGFADEWRNEDDSLLGGFNQTLDLLLDGSLGLAGADMNGKEAVCTKQMDISNAVEGIACYLNFQLSKVLGMLLPEPKAAGVILQVCYGILKLLRVPDDSVIEAGFPELEFAVFKGYEPVG